MFDIKYRDDQSVVLSGRLDASQVENARAVLEQVKGSCVIDFHDLNYISSAGLGLLLATQKRLVEAGYKLKLVNLNQHIRDVFHYAGFDKIFEIG